MDVAQTIYAFAVGYVLAMSVLGSLLIVLRGHWKRSQPLDSAREPEINTFGSVHGSRYTILRSVWNR